MILGIIQARMASTRLPKKVMADIAGRPLLRRVVERARAAATIDRVMVATTQSAEDDELEAYVRDALGVAVFRGSVDDVLDRFHRCAAPFAPSIVVRVTADDPLKDPAIIDRCVRHLLEDERLDYCSNTLRPTFPEGLDIEAFRFSALAAATDEARLASEREHVTPFIWKRPDRFRLRNFVHDEDLSDWRWTVDKPADLDFMRAVFAAFKDREGDASFREVIDLLKRRPELRAINAGTIRNEGYLRSVQKER
jgi:spore coat polysaccharide biosynthesis protein SpsF